MTVTKTNLTDLLNYIEEKIVPHNISMSGINNLFALLSKFNIDELYEAVDISFKTYIVLDENGIPPIQSINNFLQKIGGCSS
ncbi:MAG: hypothetical protein PHN72_02185 [Bacilli bacterium]|nr:hypothetical protein [Bacilli bacterium]